MLFGITSLVYLTKQDKPNYQIFFRELYFIPLVLSGFWFGLRGALATSLSITILYLPYTLINWRGFSASDIHKLMRTQLFRVPSVKSLPKAANHTVPMIPKTNAATRFVCGLICHRNAPPRAATDTTTSRIR